MPNQIGKISKETFITIINITQKYFKTISNIEKAFGSIVLECLNEYPCNIIDTLERDMNIDFDDIVADMIYTGKLLDLKTGEHINVSGEQIWAYIVKNLKKDLVESN